MSDTPAVGASDADADPGAVHARPRRQHRLLIGLLFILATIFGIAAVEAVWVNRQALNTDNWTSTSSELHDRGSLTDDEFAAQNATVMSDS